MKYESSVEYQLQRRNFAYAAVIETLWLQATGRSLTPTELGMLGSSQFRLGLFKEAEVSLLAARDGGNVEAEIELQGCRLALLKFELAREDLELLIHRTEGFLHGMALRWAGVTEAILGNTSYGVGLLNQAYREFQASGNARGMQITANMLGGILTMRGDFEKAEFYIRRSLKLSDPQVERAFWVDTGVRLFMLYAYTDRPREARETIDLMKRTIVEISPQAKASGYFNIQIRLCETVLYRLQDKKGAFVKALLSLHPLLIDKRQRHIDALLWLGPLLLDSISRMGQHQVALGIIRHLLPDRSARILPLRVVEGVILLRGGGYAKAISALEQALEAAQEGGQRLDAIRCQLYLADALYKSGWAEKAIPHLNQALRSLGHVKSNFLIRDDLDAIKSVLLYGESKPETAHLLQIMRGKVPAPLGRELQLQTFGRLSLQEDGQERKWALDEQKVLLILTYLKRQPGATVEQIAKEVLTEKHLESPKAAHIYVRQALKLLRDEFGKEAILSSQERRAAPARYRLADEFVLRLDVEAAEKALDEDDLEKFFEIYQGPFAAHLDGIFVTAENEHIEGRAYQYLSNLKRVAGGLSDVYQLERWAKLLLSVAPENEDVVQLNMDVDEAIAAASAQDLPALGTPYNF